MIRFFAAHPTIGNILMMAIIASGFTLVSAGVTWYIRGRTARWEAPHFDDPEKVRFDGLSWMPGPNGGSWAAGLTIPLSR